MSSSGSSGFSIIGAGGSNGISSKGNSGISNTGGGGISGTSLMFKSGFSYFGASFGISQTGLFSPEASPFPPTSCT